MRRQHGPSRRVEQVPLAGCSACAGKGFIKGVFHEMPCAACNGSGLVAKATGEPLAAEDLVLQLRIRLSAERRRAEHLQRMVDRAGLSGPAADYVGKPSGNWTGD